MIGQCGTANPRSRLPSQTALCDEYAVLRDGRELRRYEILQPDKDRGSCSTPPLSSAAAKGFFHHDRLPQPALDPLCSGKPASDLCTDLLQMHLHEFQKQFPIGRNGAVSARMHDISERMKNRLSGGRHLFGVQSLFAEQPEDRPRRDRR